MAEKNNSPSRPGEKRKRFRIFAFFTDERFRFTLGLFILLFSAFLILAFVSYLFTWKTDQSFECTRAFSNADILVENWSGKTGACLANLFINKWFGIASYTLPFLLLLIGFRLINIKILPLGKTLRITIIGAILSSICFGYIFGNSHGYLGSGLGGNHGYIISEWLNTVIGKTGTAFLLFILVFTFSVFSFKRFLQLVKGIFTKTPAYDPQQDTDEIPEDEIITTDLSKEHTENTIEDISIDETEKSTDTIKNLSDQDDDIELTVEKKTENDEISGKLSGNNIPENYDPTLDLSSYKLPSLDLLEDYKTENSVVSKEELLNNKNRIVETLGNYNIQIDKIKATIGPTVTLYEIVPAPGVRISKIKNLEDDIALSFSALGIRIIAPIPGRGTIGIEVPNLKPEIVSMQSVLKSRKFQESKFELTIALGKTISNETYIFDLTKMPHVLIAGATGQGKSVGLNAIITSLLYKKHPAQIKFILIDPKKVELTLYSRIERHYLAKLPDSEDAIVTNTQDVINTLNSLTKEMESRYDLLKKAQVRNIKEYNTKFISRNLNPEKGHRYLPYIIIIVDEFADLIMTAGREIETPLTRLAQLARAIGIHLIIATQRPTTNIITGVIKANFPARIAFRVTAMIDSRTILDTNGANQLIGRGDMLISFESDLIRMQCAFIDTPEIERITEYIGSQKAYPTAWLLPEYVKEDANSITEVDLKKRDDMFEEAARLVVIHQQGSTSLIQRKFSIGYNRAGRIVDQLEAAGILGPFEGSKARQVLISDEYTLEQFLNELDKE